MLLRTSVQGVTSYHSLLKDQRLENVATAKVSCLALVSTATAIRVNRTQPKNT